MPASNTVVSWSKFIVARVLGQPRKPTTNPRDGFREALETVVFVVVLVFLLKQFVVEAFVIPTGSMAETLYGYRKEITCSECSHPFELNSSCEVDPSDGHVRRVEGYCCPNCRHKQTFTSASPVPGNSSGDRVLVHKAVFHKDAAKPGDVVVFKYPDRPQKDYSAQNYIKRLWGTGGQTIAIWRGDLYVCNSLKFDREAVDDLSNKLYDRPASENDLWKLKYTYPNSDVARKVFEDSKAAGFPEAGDGFKLIRKNNVLLEEMKRIVYDNDHQNSKMITRGVPPRWAPEGDAWTGKTMSVFEHTDSKLGWLRYRHLIAEDQRGSGRVNFAATPVDNFLGYNGETTLDQFGNYMYRLNHNGSDDQKYWVGDLLVECKASFNDANAEFVMELSKGANRFQVHFKGGEVRLQRVGPDAKTMATAPAGFTAGEHHLRFANVDCRLRVWVDGKAIDFGTAADYAPLTNATFDPVDEKEEGFTRVNDIEAPVSLGAAGSVTVSKLKIWRDTYYIHINETYTNARHISNSLSTYYVQPGHYLCLGDNSAQSSDSRVWGTVPDRLLLGKAMFIFFPLDRLGFIK